jgi:hypothetical protein
MKKILPANVCVFRIGLISQQYDIVVPTKGDADVVAMLLNMDDAIRRQICSVPVSHRLCKQTRRLD